MSRPPWCPQRARRIASPRLLVASSLPLFFGSAAPRAGDEDRWQQPGVVGGPVDPTTEAVGRAELAGCYVSASADGQLKVLSCCNFKEKKERNQDSPILSIVYGVTKD
jgi:hypothetical protein